MMQPCRGTELSHMVAGRGVLWGYGGVEPTDVAAGFLEHPTRSVCCSSCHSCACWRLQIFHLSGEFCNPPFHV